MRAAISPYGRPSGNMPFTQFKDNYFDAVMAGGLHDADVLILWGGRDINSKLYKQEPHPLNQAKADANLSERDRIEWYLCQEAKAKAVPIIGICRGAQLLCAFAGGSLYQHVTGHNQAHVIEAIDGFKATAAADHHQMMNPEGTDHKIIAWSINKLSDRYETTESGNGVQPPEKEPEIVHFREINALAIQPHPEWEQDGSTFLKWVNHNLLPAFFKGEL